MIAVGIDCGSQNTKSALIKDNELLSTFCHATAFDLNQAAKEALEAVLCDAGYEEADHIAVTGFGRNNVDFVKTKINEVNAIAQGTYFVSPETDIVIDLGAESCRVIRLKDKGKVKQFEVNDKCASGAGTFIETMARTLQLSIEHMGEYSLRHTKDISINAQCVVFAESEVVSLIHQNESMENIAHGIHVGIASKVGALTRREGIEGNITFIGGTAYNRGLVNCIETTLNKELNIPEKPDCIGAIGAAVIASSGTSAQGALNNGGK